MVLLEMLGGTGKEETRDENRREAGLGEGAISADYSGSEMKRR